MNTAAAGREAARRVDGVVAEAPDQAFEVAPESQVEIAVAVEVGHGDPGEDLGIVVDDRPRRPAAADAVHVLEPLHDPGDVPDHDRVRVPVGIHVLWDEGEAAAEDGPQGVHGPAASAADVLVPPHDVGEGRRGEHVQVAVAVHVRRLRPRGAGRGREDVSDERASAAGVLVPGHAVVHRGRDEHVRVPVAVEVRPGHGERSVGGGRDDVRDERAAVAGRVLVPRHGVVVVGPCQHVEVAVAVDVCGRHGPRAVRGGDEVLGPGAAVARVVLVPEEGVVGARRHQHVEVGVAVDVRQVAS